MPYDRINCAQCLTVLAFKEWGSFCYSIPRLRRQVQTIRSLRCYPITRAPHLGHRGMPTIKGLSASQSRPLSTFRRSTSHVSRGHFAASHKTKRIRVSHLSVLQIIVGCRWITPHIISSIMSGHLVDPLEVHDEVMVWFLVSDRFAQYCSATKKNVVSIFSSMHHSAYYNHLMEMLNENNIIALLPSCRVSNIYPEGHPNKHWWNFKTDHDCIWPDGGKNVFAFLLQNKGEHECVQDLVHC